MPYVKKKKSKRSHRHDSESSIRCHCCGTRTPSVMSFNGIMARTIHCSDCVCHNSVAGHMCQLPRVLGFIYPYCGIHLKCTIPGCVRFVKEYNPKAFRLCTTHSCTAPHCPDAREGAYSFCGAHKCIRPGCDEGRHPSGRTQYCARHKCENAECGNLVAYEGDVPADDPRRFCDLHKQCARADCVRHCYMRDDGSMAQFCGEHRCRAGACDKERDGGQFCEDHTCQWPRGQCRNGLADDAGKFCTDHECAREDCQEPRDRLRGLGSAYCRDHKCQDRTCDREVTGETEWCERHQPCSTEGCMRQRVMEGETVTAHCELHTPPNCAWHHPKCTNRPVDHGRFCDDHTCTVPDCTEERDSQVRRSLACAEHRCTADGCPKKRQNEHSDGYAAVTHSFCPGHGCQATGGRCTSQALEGSRFCKRHSCAVQDCPEEARVHGNKLCPDHALTRQERIRDAARDPRRVPGGVGDPVYQPGPPAYRVGPGMAPGGGTGYGYGMPPVAPGGGMVPGMGYQYGPGQTRYHYHFP